MNGSFNRIQLKNISSVKISHDGNGSHLVSFRVMECPMLKLEQILQLKAPGLLSLTGKEIEGRIVRYAADIHSGYEITIEARAIEDHSVAVENFQMTQGSVRRLQT